MRSAVVTLAKEGERTEQWELPDLKETNGGSHGFFFDLWNQPRLSPYPHALVLESSTCSASPSRPSFALTFISPMRAVTSSSPKRAATSSSDNPDVSGRKKK